MYQPAAKFMLVLIKENPFHRLGPNNISVSVKTLKVTLLECLLIHRVLVNLREPYPILKMAVKVLRTSRKVIWLLETLQSAFLCLRPGF